MTPFIVTKGDKPYILRKFEKGGLRIENDLIVLRGKNGGIVESILYNRATLDTRLRSKKYAFERADHHNIAINANSSFVKVAYMEFEAKRKMDEKEEET